MEELINTNTTLETTNQDNQGIEQITNDILLDLNTDLSEVWSMKVPISELSTLGAAVSELIPAFRTVTTTVTTNTEGLYRLANSALGDTLKQAKDGTFWGAFKKADGGSKMARLMQADKITQTTKTIASINPATVMMAVSLASIERDLAKIEEMQKMMMSFLKHQQEAKIEGDIQTIGRIISQYKYNWDNENTIANYHQTALDIQRSARANMILYKKQVQEAVNNTKVLTITSQIQAEQKELINNLQYYRLSLYTMGAASLAEIMLSGNFKEENIKCIKDELEKDSFEYREIYSKASAYLEDMGKTALDTNILKGLGGATKALGKAIANIPFINDGQVDEFLQTQGKNLTSSAKKINSKILERLTTVSDPHTDIFMRKMDDMVTIYNHTSKICFDNENIYLIEE